MLDPKDSYQNQPPHIKVLRWLRYKPFYALWGVGATALWILQGGVIPKEERGWDYSRNRGEYAKFLIRCTYRLADFRMQNYITIREMIDSLKEEIAQEESARKS